MPNQEAQPVINVPSLRVVHRTIVLGGRLAHRHRDGSDRRGSAAERCLLVFVGAVGKCLKVWARKRIVIAG